MSLNLNSTDAPITGLINNDWTPLQIDACMYVANAKLEAFEDQACRFGNLIKLGLLERREAADALQEIAAYNSLVFEYGAARVQRIMADGLSGAAT